MAIPEAEQKKTDVAVTSTIKPSESVENSSIRGSNHTHSDIGRNSKHSIVFYDLFKKIKDFRFCMPGGWNDETIGIFVYACKKNVHDLTTKTDEVTKWKEIANTGSQISLNKTLFTVNSCMEVAQCIKKYLRTNENQLEKNESFIRFHNEVSNLLPYFPEPNLRRERCKPTVSDIRKYFSTSSFPDELFELASSDLKLLHRDSASYYQHISAYTDKIVGVTTNGRQIAYFIGTCKWNIITDSLFIRHKQLQALVLFDQLKTLEISEIFDYIEPREFTKQYYINLLKGGPEEHWIHPYRIRNLPHLREQVNSWFAAKGKPGISSIMELNNQREHNLLTNSEVLEAISSGEPSSTTHIASRDASLERNEPQDARVDEGTEESYSDDSDDEGMAQLHSTSFQKVFYVNNHKSETRTKRRRGPTQRKSNAPERILPSREAKNRATKKNRVDEGNPQSRPDSTNFFRGFAEVESFDPEERSVKLVRSCTVKRTITKTTVTKPDTTMDDDSDSGYSNSYQTSSGSSEGLIRSNRRPSGPRDRQSYNLGPDTTTMQPIVIIERNQEIENKVKSCYGENSRLLQRNKSQTAKNKRGRPPSRARMGQKAQTKNVVVDVSSDSEEDEDNPEGRVASLGYRPMERCLSPQVASTSDAGAASRAPGLPTLRLPHPPSTSHFESSVALIGGPSQYRGQSSTGPVAKHYPQDNLPHYDRRPLWVDAFLEETRAHSSWKIQQQRIMMEELIEAENRKKQVIEKLINALEKK